MRRITRFILACCFLNSLSSCAMSEFSQDAVSTFSVADRSTGERAQLMKDYEKRLEYEFWPAKVRNDEDLTGDGYNYNYWWTHRSDARSGAELEEMCAIPEAQLARMSTRNLVLTCYVYPYLTSSWAHNDPRFGLMHHLASFNGLQELQQRKSAPGELIRLYKELTVAKETVEFRVPLDYTEYLEPSHRIFGIPALTMILESAVDYGCFSKAQVKELAAAILEKIGQANKLPEGTRSWNTVSYPYVLGAMLAYHHDNSLTDEQVQMMVRFIGVGSSFPGTPMEYNEASGKYYASEETIQRYRDVIMASLDRLRK